jgi:hypothetical protein
VKKQLLRQAARLAIRIAVAYAAVLAQSDSAGGFQCGASPSVTVHSVSTFVVATAIGLATSNGLRPRITCYSVGSGTHDLACVWFVGR